MNLKAIKVSSVVAAIGIFGAQTSFAFDDAQHNTGVGTPISSNSNISIFHYSRPDSTDSKHAALELSLNGGSKHSWYAASFLGDHDKRIQLGLDIGSSNQMAVTSGQGVGYAQTRQAFSGIDPYYFHGGSRTAFQYMGASWTHHFSQNQAATFGSMNIDANALEKRQAWFAGFSNDHLRVNLIQVNRGGSSVGQALDLGFGWQNKTLSYQGLQNEVGAYSQQVQLSWYGADDNQFKMSLGSRNNPLSEDSQSSQFLISYQQSFGRAPQVFAASEEKKAEKARKSSFNSTFVLGAAAVGAAVALSSGSSDQDGGDRKNDQHEVARSVLNKINPRSVRENREYGTWIYRTPDGRFIAASIQQGELASVDLPVSIVPAGNEISASLHTHGSDDPRFANEIFSPADISGDRAFRVDGYLGTPKGKFLWHELSANRIVQLGEVAN